MNNESQEVQEVHITTSQANDAIRIMEAIIRLAENPDYKLVFIETLFKNEPARLTSLLADPNMEEHIDDIHSDLFSISNLQLWIRSQMQMGRTATKALDEDAKLKQESTEINDSYID